MECSCGKKDIEGLGEPKLVQISLESVNLNAGLLSKELRLVDPLFGDIKSMNFVPVASKEDRVASLTTTDIEEFKRAVRRHAIQHLKTGAGGAHGPIERVSIVSLLILVPRYVVFVLPLFAPANI